MLRRHFIINNEDSTIINGGLPKDIPHNTIYYWTTESVEKINEVLSRAFKCYNIDDVELKVVRNTIKNNIGIIAMDDVINSANFIFLGDYDFLDVRYIQLPKTFRKGVGIVISSNLQELYIDEQITDIDSYTILPYVGSVPNLHTIKVNKNNPIYDSRDDCNAIIKTASNTLIVGCKNTIIPNNINVIGSNAFVGCNTLYNIDIPDSVNYIKNNAFNSCGLLSITLPVNISIGEHAFMDCINLSEINYKGTIEQWNNITKVDGWNLHVPATIVHCTDGDVVVK